MNPIREDPEAAGHGPVHISTGLSRRAMHGPCPAAGVSPGMIYCAARSGVMMTRHIGNAVTMTPDLFRTREGARRGRPAPSGSCIGPA